MSHPYTSATFLALLAAVFSGVANFYTKLAVVQISDPIVYTTVKNAMVAILLFGIFFGMSEWKKIRTLGKKNLSKLLLIGCIGGSIPFAMYFTGLAQTSGVNAGLIHKTMFLWVILFSLPFLGKTFRWQYVFGIASLYASNLFIGGFKGFQWNGGELLILGATVLWAVENMIARSALREASSIMVSSARMIFGSIVLLGIVIYQGNVSKIFSLTPGEWGIIFVTSILLFGYVLTWYAALKRAPAWYVATLLVPATLITNVLSSAWITHEFAQKQWISLACMLFGIAIIVFFTHKIPNTREEKIVTV